MPTLGDLCAIACADVFRGDGAILASAMGAVPALGARLAQATFEADLMITDGIATLVGGDGRPEAWMPFSRVFDTLWNGRRHVLMGATQLDVHGNQNISCLGDHARPTLQLLGVRGAPGNTVNHPTSYWIPRHTPRVFVEAVDMICGVGTDHGAHEIRRVVTNLGVFDFEGIGRRMRLRSLHPDVTVEDVAAATGFEVEVPDGVPETRSPSPEEAACLDRLDVGAEIRGTVRGPEPCTPGSATCSGSSFPSSRPAWAGSRGPASPPPPAPPEAWASSPPRP
jgi:acyl CoA:acetate/3-ketoacid CoA transferase beta subunit